MRYRHLSSLLLPMLVGSACCRVPEPIMEAYFAAAALRPDGTYVVDGDHPLQGRDEAEAYFQRWYCEVDRYNLDPELETPEPPEKPKTVEEALILHRPAGVDSMWTITERRALTYCVDRSSAAYSQLVAAMVTASADWEAAADVDFQHVTAQDGSCGAAAPVTFHVTQVSGQPFLARAFFPDFARPLRALEVDDSVIPAQGPVTLAGVLRHELGHALGFRHEHIRAARPGCVESDDWRALTPYDPSSVMHYPQCGGTNAGDLTLSAFDIAGAVEVYGKREVCNRLDDDRDGAIDNGGVCPPETCNGADDDQDGLTDEDLVCPVPEACNGVDDDLDGAVDEGVCPQPEVCNGVDDDFDGRIDEDVCPRPETCNGADDDLNGEVDDLTSCHEVVVRMHGIDDDAFVWIGARAGDPSDAICAVRRSNNADGECDLSASMRQRGNPETQSFVLKIGNGGGWDSGGLIEVVIDGRLAFEHREARLVRHTGWIYRAELRVDFKHGRLDVGPENGCVNLLDCPN